jgi:hypothetical protein
MTLPRVFHDVFIAVVDTLAESIEGKVGPVLWIFRMFETNLRRVFLKFERFFIVKKAMPGDVALRASPPAGPCHNCASKARSRRRNHCDARADNSFGSPYRRLHSATDRSPCGAIPRGVGAYLPGGTAHAAAPCRVGSLLLDPGPAR